MLVSIEEAQRLLLELIDLSIRGERVLITRDGEVVAELLAVKTGDITASSKDPSSKESIG